MTSDLATADLDDLRAEGLKPTDEDVIRLHALACRITNGPETTAANFPRWATAGGCVFFEPTLAAHFWYAYAKTLADDTATEGFMFAFACAHGREAKYLDGLHDPEEINCALGCFMSSLTCTRAELERAVVYCVTGTDDAVPEPTEIEKARDAQSKTDAETRNFAAMKSMVEQAIVSTGMTYAEIMERTASELHDMIYAANVKAGQKMTRTSAKAHADYLATLSAIGKRLRAEKDAASAAVAATV